MHGGFLHGEGSQAGCDGGESEAIVELIHRVVKVLEGGLPEVFAKFFPPVEDSHGAATKDAQHKDGIAIAHPACILPATHIEPLVQATLDVPIAADAL